MSKRVLAWGKRRRTARRLAAFFAALAVALATAVIAGGPAYASGQNCNDNGDEVLCISVTGASNRIDQIVGRATMDSAWGQGSTGHVQVTEPDGRTLCNSPEVALTGRGVTTSCPWNGGGAPHATGNYCVTMWIYSYHGIFVGWEYTKDGPPECLNVFIS